ncbi:hypothetical protein [Viridibacterium curvum]|uniref:hypothetical protein n=1 Tax=Viridibacterium curvum TaxID=1101404 RepID=UPI0031F05072
MIVAALALLATGLTFGGILYGSVFRYDRNAHTDELAARRLASEARLAVIGYAAANVKQPGALPCPDGNGDGFAGAANCTNTSTGNRLTGCLPWRTLGLERGTDESGAPLFYTLSNAWQNVLKASERTTPAKPRLNPDIQPTVTTIYGNTLAAAILSAGKSLAAQDRGAITLSSACAGSNNAAYFEGSNSDWDAALQPYDAATNTFNDRVVEITRDDVFRVVLSPVLSAFMRSVDIDNFPEGKGLPYYFSKFPAYNAYDLAKSVSSPTGQQSSTIIDRSVAPTELDISMLLFYSYASSSTKFGGPAGCIKEKGTTPYNSPADWLCLNDWYAYIDYAPTGTSSARLSIDANRFAPPGKGRRCQLSVSIASDSLSCTNY